MDRRFNILALEESLLKLEFVFLLIQATSLRVLSFSFPPFLIFFSRLMVLFLCTKGPSILDDSSGCFLPLGHDIPAGFYSESP